MDIWLNFYIPIKNVKINIYFNYMNKIILSLLLLLLILVLFPKLNRNYENFDSVNNTDNNTNNNKNSEQDIDYESNSDSDSDSDIDNETKNEKKNNKKNTNMNKMKSNEIKSDKNTENYKNNEKQMNTTDNKEPYYDYNINYYTKSMEKIPGVNDKAININIGYPTQQPIIQQQEPQLVNNTLLSNLVGNPVDQVETDYTVTESSDMYKSWDKYYLPGYSYFPPSKWQLPKDNAILIPRELRDEKCNVCPLIANNGSDNYLSGDILQGPNNSYKITPQILNTTNNPLYDPIQPSLNLDNVENPYVADFVRTNRRNRRQQKRQDRRQERREQRQDRREDRRERRKQNREN